MADQAKRKAQMAMDRNHFNEALPKVIKQAIGQLFEETSDATEHLKKVNIYALFWNVYHISKIKPGQLKSQVPLRNIIRMNHVVNFEFMLLLCRSCKLYNFYSKDGNTIMLGQPAP